MDASLSAFLIFPDECLAVVLARRMVPTLCSVSYAACMQRAPEATTCLLLDLLFLRRPNCFGSHRVRVTVTHLSFPQLLLTSSWDS